MSTPLRYDERAALDGASSPLHWDAIVRQILRARDGEAPSDWVATVEQKLHPAARIRWGFGRVSGTLCGRRHQAMNRCTAYRRRGLSYPLPCAGIDPGDLTPEVGCADPRRLDAWARRVVAPECLAAPSTGCV